MELRAKKTGVKAPALASRPKLRFEDTCYADAFFALNKSRVQGFNGANPISISEVVAYCSLMGIASQRERPKYLHLIQLMDQVFFEHLEKFKK